MRFKTFENHSNEADRYALVCQAERKIPLLDNDFDILFAFDGDQDGDYLYISKVLYSDANTAQIKAKYFLRKCEDHLFMYIDVFDISTKKLVVKQLKDGRHPRDRKHDMFDEVVRAFYAKIENILSGRDLECNLEVMARLFPEEMHPFRGRRQGKKFGF